MSDILVKQPDRDELDKLGVFEWDTWACDVSTFDWEYDAVEICYILEGHVVVRTDQGETEIKAGDLATFPKGLRCVWQVSSPIRKHYRFE
jgi:uncharacterized cupin superfamily protein